MSETSGASGAEGSSAGAATGVRECEIICTWTARRMRPAVVLGVVGVFAVFMLLAHFVFHSRAAVVALAGAAVAALVPMAPAVLARLEYRLTDAVLERRPATSDASKPFTRLFDRADLSHLVVTQHGFKFFLSVGTKNPLLAVWRKHVSDAYSGEIHVEAADRQRVLAALSELGITVR